MANTRTSAKRARQEERRRTRNRAAMGATKKAIKQAITLITEGKKEDEAKKAYQFAVKRISAAASRGTLPKARASRKISRLTHFAARHFPASIPFKGPKVEVVEKKASAKKSGGGTVKRKAKAKAKKKTAKKKKS